MLLEITGTNTKTKGKRVKEKGIKESANKTKIEKPIKRFALPVFTKGVFLLFMLKVK